MFRLAVVLVLCAVVAFWTNPLVASEDPKERIQQGERIAQTVCIACHGPQGISQNPLWPNLAGQKSDYLVKAVKAYRDGQRQDPLMTPQSQMLTDFEIQVLAEYYSSIPIQIVGGNQGEGEAAEGASSDEN